MKRLKNLKATLIPQQIRRRGPQVPADDIINQQTQHRQETSRVDTDETCEPQILPTRSQSKMSTIRSRTETASSHNSIDSIAERNDADGNTNLWSMAYARALSSFTEEEKKTVENYTNLTELFRTIEVKEHERQDTRYMRGLKKLETPLKTLKAVVGLAEPFLSLEPTAKTASGVVNSVITLAIYICGAESQFDDEIAMMLDYIPIIDGCDALDQGLDADKSIHKALVKVYKDMIKFYITAIEILKTKAGVIAEQFRQRMPTIIKDFNRHAERLRDQVSNATAALAKEIETLLLDQKVNNLLNLDKNRARSQLHSDAKKIRVDEACQWIASQFEEWRDSSTLQQMIVLGHMGCGKTVTMAYVIDELIRWNKCHIPKPLLCFHYCKDDETGRVAFIYSSLILQLLDQQKRLKVEFNKWYKKAKSSGAADPTLSSEELGEFFSKCVKGLKRPLFMVLDGLDECDEDSRIEMLPFLNDLSERAPHLKICFSSRNSTETESLITCAMKVHVPTTDRDRDAMIVKHHVEKKLVKLKPNIQRLVIEELSNLAEGSAIWIRLSVEIIQRAGITAPVTMKNFIRNEISRAALSKLYGKLIQQASRGIDDNKRLIIDALQILAVAKRPLTITELSWAVVITEGIGKVQELRDHVDVPRVLGLMQAFISNSEEGLQRGEVRLVHQSLKELILQVAPSGWDPSNSSSKPSKADVEERQCKLEASILRLCIHYLCMEEFDQYPEAILEGDPSYSDPEVKAKLEQNFGEFFDYACLWPLHFSHTGAKSISIIPQIVELSTAGSNRLANWSVRHRHSGYCTGLWKYLDKPDPLAVVVIYGPEVVLEELLLHYDIEFQSDLVYDISFLLIHGDHISRAKLLLKYCPPRNAQLIWGLFVIAMTSWQRFIDAGFRNHLGGLIELLELIKGSNSIALAQEQILSELLVMATCLGCLPMFEILFDEAGRNQTVEKAIYSDLANYIREAIDYNRIDIVRFLLEQEGAISYFRRPDDNGNNMFHEAASQSRVEMIELFLSHFKDFVNQTNNDGETALCWLVDHSQWPSVWGPSMDTSRNSGHFQKRIASGTLLLKAGGADVRAGYRDHPEANPHEPLRIAARYGDAEMCRLLVEVGGADPRSVMRIENGRVSLLDEVEEGENPQETIETLCSLAKIEMPTQEQE